MASHGMAEVVEADRLYSVVNSTEADLRSICLESRRKGNKMFAQLKQVRVCAVLAPITVCWTRRSALPKHMTLAWVLPTHTIMHARVRTHTHTHTHVHALTDRDKQSY